MQINASFRYLLLGACIGLIILASMIMGANMVCKNSGGVFNIGFKQCTKINELGACIDRGSYYIPLNDSLVYNVS
jgi:hypothetical protein